MPNLDEIYTAHVFFDAQIGINERRYTLLAFLNFSEVLQTSRFKA